MSTNTIDSENNGVTVPKSAQPKGGRIRQEGEGGKEGGPDQDVRHQTAGGPRQQGG
jgi:hypothetical protein